MKRSALTNWLLAAVLIALLVVSFLVGSQRQTDGEEAFAGTDSIATEMMEQEGVKPWFSPVFEPGSGELESGLFALQAGLGGIAFGYCIGVLRERNRGRTNESSGTDAQGAAGVTEVSPIDLPTPDARTPSEGV